MHVRLIPGSKLAMDVMQIKCLKFKKHCMDVWINLACRVKRFDWSVRLDELNINASQSPFLCH